MTTFRYLITAEDAGDQIQHFLRFKHESSLPRYGHHRSLA